MSPVGLDEEIEMKLLADIASGNTTWADIFFLVAVIVAFATVLLHITNNDHPLIMVAVCVALGFVALGLLVL